MENGQAFWYESLHDLQKWSQVCGDVASAFSLDSTSTLIADTGEIDSWCTEDFTSMPGLI